MATPFPNPGKRGGRAGKRQVLKPGMSLPFPQGKVRISGIRISNKDRIIEVVGDQITISVDADVSDEVLIYDRKGHLVRRSHKLPRGQHENISRSDQIVIINESGLPVRGVLIKKAKFVGGSLEKYRVVEAAIRPPRPFPSPDDPAPSTPSPPTPPKPKTRQKRNG